MISISAVDGLEYGKQAKKGDGLVRLADIMGMVPDIPFKSLLCLYIIFVLNHVKVK